MPIPQAAVDLENREQLADAYEILKQLWSEGNRDRELALHLIFLTWFGIIEPVQLTGFPDTEEMRHELKLMFKEVHARFESQIYQDAEMLYVVGVIAQMHWFMLDDEIEIAKAWEARGQKYHEQYRALAPHGIDPLIFLNRGAYGDYFAGQAKVVEGY
jgi:hypothetical protein